MATPQSVKAQGGALDRYFRLQENGTTVRKELLAGLTTFLALAYIVPTNSGILSDAGMPFEAVVMATCISAFFATLLMGLYANYPFALAPGMGLNAYFAYSIVIGMGVSWQTALGAVFISGVIFLLLSVTTVREKIINAVPMSLKYAIAAGIGLFLAFIGLQNSGIVVSNPATFVALGDFGSASTLLAIIGLLITAALVVRRVRGGILLGILITTIIGIPMGVTSLPDRIVSWPSFATWAPVFGQLDIASALNLGLTTVIFAFFFVDLFDTAGTLIGLSDKAGYLDEKGNLPRVGKALVTDSVGTMVGSVFGTSTVTTYIESSAGIAEGGRTGLTSVTVAVLFLVALVFTPVIAIIPGAATAPALILIGAMMISSLGKIEWEDMSVAIPAFLAMIVMPLTYSIANGIFLSFVAYSFIMLVTGRISESSPIIHALSVLFILKFIAGF